ncbi:uncharacterized protein LOC125594745 [Brassica napus]|nr:uncharacterized protein LOC125594745 [Brassica napus]
MSVEELDANEKQAFLNWRRMFVRLEENEKLVLTPFEKNLDIWRQLWRVLERSDLIVMVVDARDVLVPALQKRDIIARAKTGTAKTVTGNTTLDVKAERAEGRRCSHTSEIHAKAKKGMGAQGFDLVPLFSIALFIFSSDVCVRFDENVDCLW